MSLEKMISEMVAETVREILSEIKEDIVSDIGPVLTVQEAADYLRMSKSWVQKELKHIPHFHLGTRLLFNREDLDSWRLNKTDLISKVNISQVKRNTDFRIK